MLGLRYPREPAGVSAGRFSTCHVVISVRGQYSR